MSKRITITAKIIDYSQSKHEYTGIVDGREITIDPFVTNAFTHDKTEELGKKYEFDGMWFDDDEKCFLPSTAKEINS